MVLLDLLTSRLGTLISQFSASPDDVREQIRDYSSYMVERTREFVGREFVFKEIDQFIEHHPRGYVVVRAMPGVGKSALAAQLVKRHGAIHHFNILAEGVTTTAQFQRNVSAQLIAAYRPTGGRIAADGQELRVLLERAARAVPERKLVVVVDALDEAEHAKGGMSTLALPLELPPGVFFILTTRPDGYHVSLDLRCETKQFVIDERAANNLADIRAFIERYLQRPGIRKFIDVMGKQSRGVITDASFIKILEQRSEGNFMYLRYVLPDIEQGRYANLSIDQLPQGLKSIYEVQWKRMGGSSGNSDWLTYKLPVLEALTVTRRPISVDLLTRYAGVPKRRVLEVLEEWEQFLYREETTFNEGKKTRYRFYHQSFFDFMNDKVDLDEARKRMLLAETDLLGL